MDSRVTTSTTTPMTGCALIRILFVDDFSWRNDLVRGQYILIVVYSIFMVWDLVFFMSFSPVVFRFVFCKRENEVWTHTHIQTLKQMKLFSFYSQNVVFLFVASICLRDYWEEEFSLWRNNFYCRKKASPPVAVTMLRFSSFFHLVACVAVSIDHRSILEHLLFGSSATSPLRLLCLHKMKTGSK